MLLAAINIVGTLWGGAFQNITTVIKVGFVGLLALLPFLTFGEPKTYTLPLTRMHRAGSLWAAVAVTLAGIMWAYDGWGMVTVVAEEIHEPQRNIPWRWAAAWCS